MKNYFVTFLVGDSFVITHHVPNPALVVPQKVISHQTRLTPVLAYPPRHAITSADVSAVVHMSTVRDTAKLAPHTFHRPEHSHAMRALPWRFANASDAALAGSAGRFTPVFLRNASMRSLVGRRRRIEAKPLNTSSSSASSRTQRVKYSKVSGIEATSAAS